LSGAKALAYFATLSVTKCFYNVATSSTSSTRVDEGENVTPASSLEDKLKTSSETETSSSDDNSSPVSATESTVPLDDDADESSLSGGNLGDQDTPTSSISELEKSTSFENETVLNEGGLPVTSPGSSDADNNKGGQSGLTQASTTPNSVISDSATAETLNDKLSTDSTVSSDADQDEASLSESNIADQDKPASPISVLETPTGFENETIWNENGLPVTSPSSSEIGDNDEGQSGLTQKNTTPSSAINDSSGAETFNENATPISSFDSTSDDDENKSKLSEGDISDQDKPATPISILETSTGFENETIGNESGSPVSSEVEDNGESQSELSRKPTTPGSVIPDSAGAETLNDNLSSNSTGSSDDNENEANLSEVNIADQDQTAAPISVLETSNGFDNDTVWNEDGSSVTTLSNSDVEDNDEGQSDLTRKSTIPSAAISDPSSAETLNENEEATTGSALPVNVRPPEVAQPGEEATTAATTASSTTAASEEGFLSSRCQYHKTIFLCH
jgi:hypothetical protein